MYSVILEVGEDEEGETPHLVTLWKSIKEKSDWMKKTRKPIQPVSAGALARLALVPSADTNS
jgi:hypothetical protein